MSQAKVDRNKERKANKKKIVAQEKRNRLITIICGWAVLIAVVSWAGYSAYGIYEKSKPVETVYTNLDAINDYTSTLMDEE